MLLGRANPRQVTTVSSALFRNYCIVGGTPGGGGEPRLSIHGFLTFPRNIVVFRDKGEIVTTLSIGYDERRLPFRGSLAAGSVIKIQKNSLPAVPRRGPEAEVSRRDDDFCGSGVIRTDS